MSKRIQHPEVNSIVRNHPGCGDVWSDTEAAAYLHVKPRTLRFWRQMRGLPFLAPTPKVRLYRRTDLDAWLDRSRTVIS